jgi:hypothetical protein
MTVREAEMLSSTFTAIYNLQANTMSAVQYIDSLKVVPARKVRYFSSEALGQDSAR